jgi:alpha-1,3-rhamnosyl/mannosyltransferase
LHIGVDARALNVTFVRGMGGYLRSLLCSLLEDHDLRLTLFGDRPGVGMSFPQHAAVATDIFEVRGHRFAAWEQLGLPWRARAAEVDLLFCPGSAVPLWQPVPTVVTIHDTIMWEPTKQPWTSHLLLHRVLPKAYHRAAEIITISQSSKTDIESQFPFLEGRCTVIPHGLDAVFASPSHSRDCGSALPGSLRAGKYVLYVGGNIPRKRPEWAIRVFHAAMPKPIRLAMIGIDAACHESFFGEIPQAVRDRVALLPYQSDESVAALYSNAIAVLYPTLYEGFGFPVLQSHAAGVPVLHSAAGSLRELSGPASVVRDPDDFEGWCEALRSCLHPIVDVDASRAWGRRFSWRESAARHHEVFVRALTRTE